MTAFVFNLFIKINEISLTEEWIIRTSVRDIPVSRSSVLTAVKEKRKNFTVGNLSPKKYGCLFITWFTTMVVNKNVNFQKKVIKIVYTAKNSKIIYYFIEDNRKNGYNKLKKGG